MVGPSDAHAGGPRLDDWLLGLRRRQVLDQLRKQGDHGVHPRELVESLGSTRQHLRELLRVFEGAGAVERVDTRYRLRAGDPLADALVALLNVLDSRRDAPLDLPPSRR